MDMIIRRFEPADVTRVLDIIHRNFIEVNSKDYPAEEIARLLQVFDAERILRTAQEGHFYVLCLDGTVMATGAIAPFWGREQESILLTIFVAPERHGRGLGKRIVQTLERDPFFLRARRVEVPASITAHAFYARFGYGYIHGTQPDEEGLVRMEKVNN